MSEPAHPSAVAPSEASSYDEVPYDSRSIPDTHPRHLATIAVLHGIAAAAPATCRVLELGCGRGDNLMAMASTLPRASFVGVDGSPRQIADGEKRRVAAGLDNLRLLARDFASLEADLGEFDYVICHGVYSWVSEETAALLLRLCRRHLAPNGIVFLSFNTYPGWHTRSMLREMMQFHVRAIDDPKEKVQQARALAEFLARYAVDDMGTYRARFRALADDLAESGDSYFFHEFLEENNRPLYFTEFAERAAAAGLQYVASSMLPTWDAFHPAEVREFLAPLKDRIVREQYLDYLSDRTFRRVLLVRTGLPVAETEDPGVVPRLFVSGRARSDGPASDPSSTEPQQFRVRPDVGVTTGRPLVKAALTALENATPLSYSFDELWAETRRLMGASEPDASRKDLAEFLVQSFAAGLVGLTLERVPIAYPAPEKPRATRLVRLQAAEGDRLVTNLQHRLADLADIDRCILKECDGSRGRPELEAALVSAVERGELSLVDGSGTAEADLERARAMAGPAIAGSLDRLARIAMFVAEEQAAPPAGPSAR